MQVEDWISDEHCLKMSEQRWFFLHTEQLQFFVIQSSNGLKFLELMSPIWWTFEFFLSFFTPKLFWEKTLKNSVFTYSNTISLPVQVVSLLFGYVITFCWSALHVKEAKVFHRKSAEIISSEQHWFRKLLRWTALKQLCSPVICFDTSTRAN